MNMNSPLKQKGISLIEVLVAMAITTLSILGLTKLQLENLRNSINTDQNSQAIFVTDNIINSIYANSDHKEQYLTQEIFGNNNFQNCNNLKNKSKKYCSSHHNGSTRQKAQSCQPEELAVHDIYSSMCNQLPATNQETVGNQGFLINPEIKIEEVNQGEIKGELKITLQWYRRIANEAIDKNELGTYQINIIP